LRKTLYPKYCKTFGEENKKTIILLRMLGISYRNVGMYEESIELLSKANLLSRRTFNCEEEDYILPTYSLAIAYSKINNYELSLANYREVYDFYCKNYGEISKYACEVMDEIKNIRSKLSK
jgi:tetratricopeptide (TPR) repeat protein